MVKKNYKSKGRQSNGYDGYKSLRAIHQHELNNAVNDTIRWTRHETAWTQERHKQQQKERPRFSFDATNNSLRHIVRDRKSEDSYLLRERRRRNGFLLPSIITTTTTTNKLELTTEGEWGLVHTPGWILRYNNNNNDYNEESSSSSLSDSYNNNNNNFNNNNNKNNNVNVKVQKLQDLSLIVFSKYIHDYQNVMGSKTLQTILSLLSSNCLMELSILLCTSYSSSSSSITNDDLAVLLGQHSHVERLCLRGSNSTNNNTNLLTDAGILKLIPKTTILQRRRRQLRQQHKNEDNNDDNSNKKDNEDDDNESVLECWEEEEVEDGDTDYIDNDNDDHVYHTECHDDDDDDDYYAYEDEEEGDNNNSSVIIDGIVGSLKLRRLELLDLVSCGSSNSEDGSCISSISVDVLLRWFDKCSGITHLSLAGSFYFNNNSWSIGRTIVLELHKVLPYLEVLDITRCPWVTESLILRFLEGYYMNNNNNNNNCNNNSNNNSKSTTTNTHSSSPTSANISRVVVAAAPKMKTTSSQSSLMSSLPIVYYYRGRFTLNEKQKQYLLNSQQHHQDQDNIDAAHDDWW